MKRGFTLIELILAMAIFSTLIGISSISLLNTQRKSSLTAAVQVFLADLKAQQVRAMVGDQNGGGIALNYGVRFETTRYTLFQGSYGINNFVVNLPANEQFVGSYPDMIFLKGSGEIGSATTVTIKDVNDNSQKVITINRYGVVTGVN